tara:strand:+ start:7262 stop:7906 length:645 start_codon:yes stop_codon:yes gene_type:complete
VGQSKDIASRWKKHLYQLQRGTHHCKSLQDAFSSSSVENFDFTVLLVCKKKDLLLNEIKIWEEQENCYNGRPRKSGFSDATPETKLRMSKSQKKRPPTTPETKLRMSQAQKGKKLSEEHKKNISEAIKRSDNHKGFIKGHKHSTETKLKLSQNCKGKGTKPLLQYDKNNVFIKEWASATDASKATGINNGNISQCCRGIYKTSGGYIWKFKEKK